MRLFVSIYFAFALCLCPFIKRGANLQIQSKMPPKRGPGRPPKVRVSYPTMGVLDSESVTVSEADLVVKPHLGPPETLIAGREKRTIKRSIKLEQEDYYETEEDDYQVFFR